MEVYVRPFSKMVHKGVAGRSKMSKKLSTWFMDDPYDYVYLVHTDHRNSIYFCNECIHECILNVRTELNVICVSFFSFSYCTFGSVDVTQNTISMFRKDLCIFGQTGALGQNYRKCINGMTVHLQKRLATY